MKRGHVGMQGATGAALDRSLSGIRELLDRTLLALRADVRSGQSPESFELAPFIAEVRTAAALDSSQLRSHLTVGHVPPGLFMVTQRHVIASAIATLIRSASRFARHDGDVVLTVRESTARVLIEIQGECGGARPDGDQVAADFGLAAIRAAIQEAGGTLSLSEPSEKSCVFTLSMPRSTLTESQL
jgi:hypothetical protein